MRIKNIIVLLVLFFGIQCGKVYAESLKGLSNESSNISATNPWMTELYVFGAGESLEEWWGHIGLYIKNIQTKEEHFYNWGGFSFDEKLILGFATGRLRFWVSDEPLRPYLQFYRRNNRDIKVSKFNLTAEKAEKLNYLAKINMLPENREYDYEYFKNNCATRIRDLFDNVLDGQLSQKYKDEFSETTTREHVHILTSRSWLMDLSLNFLLSSGVDKKLSKWDEMFLPEELERHFNSFVYVENNQPIKLVSNRHTFFSSTLKKNTKANSYIIPAVIFGILYLVMSFYFRRQLLNLSYKGIPLLTRIFLSLVLFGTGIIMGIPALVLFDFNLASQHTYTYWNINIFFGNPLCLFFVIYAIFLLFKKTVSEKYWKLFFKTYVSLLVISLVIKIFPNVIQENFIYILIYFPMIIGNLALINSINRITIPSPEKVRETVIDASLQ